MRHLLISRASPSAKPRTLLYHARKRLFRNRPAFLSLWFIAWCSALAALGYLVMPDGTPNANDSAVQIQKKGPGFTVQLLKLRKDAEVPTVNLLQKLLYGQESPYTLVPLMGYRIEGLNVVVKPYGSRREETFSIVDAVLPLFIGQSAKLPASARFLVEGDRIRYLDLREQIQTLSTEEVLKSFRENHLETRRYWLGTDKAGRDMLSRLLLGIRISLGIGLVSVLISLLVGVSLGALAGFFGGWVDQFIMWFMTVVWSIPSIMLVIAITLALQSRGVWATFVAVGLTSWVEIARVVRGQMMSIREKLYIEAARSLGVPNRRIISHHILPNMLGPIIVLMTANFASAILTEAGLSFLGLGVQPPMPSWGSMIHEGFQAIGSRGSWPLVLFPSLCVSAVVLAFNLLGNGLRDAFDPNTFAPGNQPG